MLPMYRNSKSINLSATYRNKYDSIWNVQKQYNYDSIWNVQKQYNYDSYIRCMLLCHIVVDVLYVIEYLYLIETYTIF